MDPLSLNAVLSSKPNLTVERIEPDTIYLIGETQRHVVSDRRALALVELIDGRRTVQETIESARPRISEPEALYVLTQLVARGYLIHAPRDLAPPTAAFWAGIGVNAVQAQAALCRTTVAVKTLGDHTLGEYLREALGQAGVRVASDAELEIVVTDDYLRAELDEINRVALRSGSSWCLVKPCGIQPLIGPFFRPHAGPCWHCLAFYLRNNRPVEELIRIRRGQEWPVSPPPAMLQATLKAASGLSALAIARALAAGSADATLALDRELFALDLSSFNLERHAVVRRPQCPSCGDPDQTAQLGKRPIELRAVVKAAFEDGGYRQNTPRQTYEAYRHWVSPLTGAVTHLVPVPERDTELRAVYASGYLVRPRSGVPVTNTFDKGCAGKGRCADQARVSALCEALERFSGVCQGDEARLRSSAEELESQALTPDVLHNFSERQYGMRPPRESVVHSREWIPEPFDPKATIDWAYAWSMSSNQRRFVPFSYCYAEAPDDAGGQFSSPCGNGVAAGTCIEEAILQGLLELVERDAAGVWWYNQVLRPRLDWAKLGDSYIDQIIRDYARVGWTVWALDLTHDLEIPVYVALAHEPTADRFVIGFGCHLDARLALYRALTELNQLFDPSAARPSPWDSAGLLSRAYLFGDGSVGWPTPTRGVVDLRSAIEACMQRLDRVGLEMVVVNKTRPDIGLSVAQVIVPGLRHFWPRFGAGRLYTVPCAMNWLATARSELELNPVPLFL